MEKHLADHDARFAGLTEYGIQGLTFLKLKEEFEIGAALRQEMWNHTGGVLLDEFPFDFMLLQIVASVGQYKP